MDELYSLSRLFPERPVIMVTASGHVRILQKILCVPTNCKKCKSGATCKVKKVSNQYK